MSATQDITSFSGFGSWMSSFTPQESDDRKEAEELDGTRPEPDHSVFVHELPADYAHDPKELDANANPVDVKAPYPQPIPPPAPQPRPRPQPSPVPPHRKRVSVQRLPVYQEMPDPISTIQVHGLQKVGASGRFTDTIRISRYGHLFDINTAVRTKGHSSPIAFTNQSNECLPLSTPVGLNEAPWFVLVTTGKSCYDPDKGLRINIDEPFSTFLNRLQVSVKCKDSRISVNDGDLKIGFHRTLRVPEDGRVHLLPADFGLFPVQNMAAYEAKLRKSGNPSLLDMVRKSGVFFPIFQREALWLSFQVPKGSEYAIRVFVGGVNVVSGRKWDAPAKEGDHKDQDYIIVPQQKHLDGITVGDGVVRQFVAMPIGTGYSIEKQITGKEDVGGIQLEITPVSAKMRLSFANGAPIPWEQDSKTFAPRHYRLQPGEDIKMTRWDMGDAWLGGKRTTEQKKLIRELLKPSPNGVHIVTAVYNIKLRITVHGRLRKHTIETAEFSPFTCLDEVAKATKYKNGDLEHYHFYDRSGKLLARGLSLLRNGLQVDVGISARKMDPKEVVQLVPYGSAYPPTQGAYPPSPMAHTLDSTAYTSSPTAHTSSPAAYTPSSAAYASSPTVYTPHSSHQASPSWSPATTAYSPVSQYPSSSLPRPFPTSSASHSSPSTQQYQPTYDPSPVPEAAHAPAPSHEYHGQGSSLPTELPAAMESLNVSDAAPAVSSMQQGMAPPAFHPAPQAPSNVYSPAAPASVPLQQEMAYGAAPPASGSAPRPGNRYSGVSRPGQGIPMRLSAWEPEGDGSPAETGYGAPTSGSYGAPAPTTYGAPAPVQSMQAIPPPSINLQGLQSAPSHGSSPASPSSTPYHSAPPPQSQVADFGPPPGASYGSAMNPMSHQGPAQAPAPQSTQGPSYLTTVFGSQYDAMRKDGKPPASMDSQGSQSAPNYSDYPTAAPPVQGPNQRFSKLVGSKRRSDQTPISSIDEYRTDDSQSYTTTASPSTPSTTTAVPSSRTSITSTSPADSYRMPSSHPPPKPQKQEPPQESWAMGLAAGGLIKQEIRRDTNIYRSPRLNQATTTLISVQLLNSVAYEAITGMLCPPTPITMREYVNAGIPWFDNYKNQTASTEGAYNFNRIASVAEIDSSKSVDADASVALSRNVACTICRRNFCDCVLRPCNHAFCAACVRATMQRQNVQARMRWVECRVCGTVASGMVGFSAPMALPGMENFEPDWEREVVVLAGGLEGNVFELA